MALGMSLLAVQILLQVFGDFSKSEKVN